MELLCFTLLSNMQFIYSRIKGLVEIKPRIFTDERGFFFESYHQKAFVEHGIPASFVQDNQSFSHKGVLRGLHLQLSPYAQGKLVRVVTGRALDVAVDLRDGSPTFGQHETFVLDAGQNNMVYIPEGFAHGFLALQETILQYKCTNFYNKTAESGILWNDPQLDISWGTGQFIISEKDQQLPTLEKFLQQKSS
jgi:dTDP-4-dehydrorhamnose 3,5-epimerase